MDLSDWVWVLGVSLREVLTKRCYVLRIKVWVQRLVRGTQRGFAYGRLGLELKVLGDG